MHSYRPKSFKSWAFYRRSWRARCPMHRRSCLMTTRYPSRWPSSTIVSKGSRSSSMIRWSSGSKREPQPEARPRSQVQPTQPISQKSKYACTENVMTTIVSWATSFSTGPVRRTSIRATTFQRKQWRQRRDLTRFEFGSESCQYLAHRSPKAKLRTTTS